MRPTVPEGTDTASVNAPSVAPVLPAGDELTEALDTAEGLFRSLYAPRFPSPELASAAAGMFDAEPWRDGPGGQVEPTSHGGAESIRWRLSIGAGALAVSTYDPARRERAAEREEERHRVDADMMAAYAMAHGGELPPQPTPTREVTEWSRKSRSNMIRALAELDYSPMFDDPSRLPAMVTLTYPGKWQEVATSGKKVKAHLSAWRRRYERAWKVKPVYVWKMELQARGAPHFHIWICPPHGLVDGKPFRAWLSESWAAVVNHPDPEQYRRHVLAGTAIDYPEGLKATDPKRLSLYFSKHSAWANKEYQHIVPEEWREPEKGPGRFWGAYGLKRRTALVDVAPEDGVQSARLLRGWSKAAGSSGARHAHREDMRPHPHAMHRVEVWRARGGFAEPKYPDVLGVAGLAYLEPPKARKRKVRRRVVRMKRGRGYLTANDGPALAATVARALERMKEET